MRIRAIPKVRADTERSRPVLTQSMSVAVSGLTTNKEVVF
jgi:hypothetical protein